MTNISIALVGNPNSGKTSIFNAVTGANQFVGNWPGVTVERKEGQYIQNEKVLVQDLPGIYSLSPYTPEEVVARDYLIGQQPDGLIDVVDATNLERNLYLTLQLIEIGVPMVIALNMIDVIRKENKRINIEKLAYGLGTPVIETSATKQIGIQEVMKKAIHVHNEEMVSGQGIKYDHRLEAALSEIQGILTENEVGLDHLRWFSIKFFERDQKIMQENSLPEKASQEIEEIIQMTEKILGEDSESIIINERYQFITQLTQLCVVSTEDSKENISDRIDKVITNRWLALPIFAFVMWLVYFLSIQTVGTMGTDWVNDVLFGEIVPNHVTNFLQSIQVASWMERMIVEGILAGIGAVLGFLPQLMVLFLCLSFLENCGYMSRIAFVLDRIFRRFGLSGKSFIPMLVATGCGVPGIMASRTIENETDRRITIMVTTFIPCSAKLPIIALIAGAFFPHSSWVAPSAYFVGMLAIVWSSISLKKFKVFKEDPVPFIMELPPYHMPKLRSVLQPTWNRSKSFIKNAGTIIFVSSILIWFLSNYNIRLQAVSENESMLAGIGSGIAWLFAPLGWGTWQATVATFTGLVAKENVVGTFGVLYGGVKEVSESGLEVWQVLRQAYTPLAAYSFLLFNLLCAPCFAAVGAIHREMADWRWTGMAVAFQCALAYAISFIVYQLGFVFLGYGPVGLGFVSSIVLLMVMIYLLVRPTEKKVTILSTI
ncbi:ferrous iron transport protein B [Vagococcus humatus]|uniref:Ferrous iron transport protein B n=1 Tax=Vagococcus humatus TaxID=1889241 RepID=A0A429Z6M6_9ENTE|nr:ferrous iron transport protein B [Vagococcus humatus]RST89325.1 ferrous iron transport protein B [Vagococcus humatus]